MTGGPITDDVVRLRDGRALAYATWGDPLGVPIFFFHGTPLSRLYCPDQSVTDSRGVRLVTVDRPGIGGSDVLPRRTFADWPNDVVHLADTLGMDTFSVIGWSAGGPYAAACAALIPGRLSSVGIGASRHLSQFNIVENPSAYDELDSHERQLFDLAHEDPDAAARAAAEADGALVREIREHPEAFLEAHPLPEADRWFFEDPERRRMFLGAVRESVRQGPEAFAWELIDRCLPWGFRVADVATLPRRRRRDRGAGLPRRAGHVGSAAACRLPRREAAERPADGVARFRPWSGTPLGRGPGHAHHLIAADRRPGAGSSLREWVRDQPRVTMAAGSSGNTGAV